MTAADPAAATRARLADAHAAYLERPATDSRRLAVQMILGGIGDLGHEQVVMDVLCNTYFPLGDELFTTVARRVARQVRGCTVTITWPDEDADA